MGGGAHHYRLLMSIYKRRVAVPHRKTMYCLRLTSPSPHRIRVLDASLCGASASAESLRRFFTHALTRTLTHKPRLTGKHARRSPVARLRGAPATAVRTLNSRRLRSVRRHRSAEGVDLRQSRALADRSVPEGKRDEGEERCP